ncbi:MAG TPA: hypothetical protein EYQ50_07985 [Verrucomicrobiales bacterium]|nr:hypothetical protein [Verrucomicrobiales bacterium]
MVRTMMLTIALASMATNMGAVTAGEVVVAPTDEKIVFTGRWNREDVSQPWCSWQGCSIIAKFEGTGIVVTLEAVDVGKDIIFVIIDNDVVHAKSIALDRGKKDYVLASGLADGEHKVEIVKKSNAWKDRVITFHGFVIQGGGLLDPPARPKHKIEFYGDSNFAGNSVGHEENKGNLEFRDSYYCAVGIASRMLDAEYHNNSQGGGRVQGIMARYWDRYYPESEERWDFTRNSPEVVVVNIGANDVRSKVPDIKKAYHKFLNALRETHAKAHIVVMNGYGWAYNEPANYTAEIVKSRNDPNMSVLHFPWVFEKWHGCQYDHSGMANMLADHLSDLIGWEKKPSDVMNGFGRNGDVANGSFEEIAPFGGYGWRYISAKGVSRISDADDALDGTCYVRLSHGDNVHQPNPANGGEKFAVSVWMRGQKAGDEGVISIEFKDQKMWTNPLEVNSQKVALTTDWKKYSISATAPTGGAKPVFQIKVIFKGVEGSVVDIDNVKMDGPGH